MYTRIFFAYEERIPSGVLYDLMEKGADCNRIEYDSSLREEICLIEVHNKSSLIRVMHYFQNLNDYDFKYYFPIQETAQIFA